MNSEFYQQILYRLRVTRRFLWADAVLKPLVLSAMAGFSVLAFLQWIGWVRITQVRSSFFTFPLQVVSVGLCVTALLSLGQAYRQYRNLSQVARVIENQFHVFGLRLSASLQAPDMNYTSPEIREALWKDTLQHIERVPWSEWIRSRFRGLGRLVAVWLFLMTLTFVLAPLIQRGFGWDSDDSLLSPSPPTSGSDNRFHPDSSFTATLEIFDPGKDQWATKIEAIPIQFEGKSSTGFENLRVRASRNGEPHRDFPIGVGALLAGEQVGEAALYLDEFDLEDFDTVSYGMVAEVKKPSGEVVEVASPIFFVQIRPFRKDARMAESGNSAAAQELMGRLDGLIEEQRRVVRGTWTVQSEVAIMGRSPELLEAGKTVLASQVQVHQQAVEAYQFAGTQGQDGVSAETLDLLEQARVSMELALPHLRAEQWSDALPAEQKALSLLVQTLRNIEEVIPENKKPLAEQEKKGVQNTLKDRQTYRYSDLLRDLVQQQEKLNQQNQQPHAGRSRQQQESSSQERDALREKQQELAKQAQEILDDRRSDHSLPLDVRGLVEEAKKLMEEAARERVSEDSWESEEIQARALEKLQQASVRQQKHEHAQLAREFQRMMEMLAGDRENLRRSDSRGTSQQEEIVEKLEQMKNRLQQAGNEKDHVSGPLQVSLNRAVAEIVEAQQRFEKKEGRPEDLDAPLKAMAECYQKKVGRQQYLAELDQELRSLQQQIQGVQKQANKDAQKSRSEFLEALAAERSKILKEWLDQWKKQAPGLKSALDVALNPEVEVSSAGEGRGSMLSPEERKEVLSCLEKWNEMTRELHQEGNASDFKANPLAAWLPVVQQLKQSLQAELHRLQYRYETTAMFEDDMPEEYRNEVSRYFERLSREMDSSVSPRVPVESR